ncbi:unnamed protein product [Orchesella dallaii]|uniref:Isopenicillin N synthase-like Fe(2+) 2OG dioxygenase domain-containing protein n=1 Tax=Orchesella dallaii TaxID=48710 RepID=A0ABP1R3Y2_9HEXA
MEIPAHTVIMAGPSQAPVQEMSEPICRFPTLSWKSSNAELCQQMLRAQGGVILFKDLSAKIPIIEIRETFCTLLQNPKLCSTLNDLFPERGVYSDGRDGKSTKEKPDQKVMMQLSCDIILELLSNHAQFVEESLGSSFLTVLNFYNSVTSSIIPRLLNLSQYVLKRGMNTGSDSEITGIHHQGNYNYRAVEYFPIKINKVRCAEHREFGTFTVLFQDQKEGGMEVNCYGEWIPIPKESEMVFMWDWSAFIFSNGRIMPPSRRVVPLTNNKHWNRAPFRFENSIHVAADVDAFLRPILTNEASVFDPTAMENLTVKKFHDIIRSSEVQTEAEETEPEANKVYKFLFAQAHSNDFGLLDQVTPHISWRFAMARIPADEEWLCTPKYYYSSVIFSGGGASNGSITSTFKLDPELLHYLLVESPGSSKCHQTKESKSVNLGEEEFKLLNHILPSFCKQPGEALARRMNSSGWGQRGGEYFTISEEEDWLIGRKTSLQFPLLIVEVVESLYENETPESSKGNKQSLSYCAVSCIARRLPKILKKNKNHHYMLLHLFLHHHSSSPQCCNNNGDSSSSILLQAKRIRNELGRRVGICWFAKKELEKRNSTDDDLLSILHCGKEDKLKTHHSLTSSLIVSSAYVCGQPLSYVLEWNGVIDTGRKKQKS